MNKVKITAIFSTLETIWAIGVSCMAGALSPYAYLNILQTAQEGIELKG
ncbi:MULTISPECIES: hypothetical protein [Vibrio]|uniref:Uncharacterized protein n=2 Tax=Vibrio TaxID=662 RepID=A0AA43G713_VIBSP|nr:MULTISPECIES: hypothetical protein [Vibrio]MDH5924305.1 hypothetical protein [Vibrio splendidus]TCL18346.1 hypothetical protein EDB52_12421 [Vibrio crassostreae]TCN98135.1 hypothetical protein EDB30_11449 [Vibrio crassostreae]TCT45154.1 hypothetical protein EDB39_1226 [Vibrio crassostreae]TCT46086.1 hypothetical protein EDB42_1236 [Vibrio crassostreae]